MMKKWQDYNNWRTDTEPDTEKLSSKPAETKPNEFSTELAADVLLESSKPINSSELQFKNPPNVSQALQEQIDNAMTSKSGQIDVNTLYNQLTSKQSDYSNNAEYNNIMQKLTDYKAFGKTQIYPADILPTLDSTTNTAINETNKRKPKAYFADSSK